MFKFTLTLNFILFSLLFLAQDYQLVRPTAINSNNIENSTKNTVKENSVTKTYLVKNEEYYTEFISALKGKKAYLESDSTLNAKAISLNWYDRIGKEIEKAEKELLKLKQDEK
ncbi:MAG: hypothetical protein N4A35_15670 [Flavobacteriales bacterium]|jgi:hypothetical protein|nr:hypothetical protein [Flavobacteriales bacterium]